MRRWIIALAAMALLAVTAGPVAAADPTATWVKTSPGPPVIWDAAAFAGSTCQLVTFGGTTGSASPTATNLFDPRAGTWTTIPAPRRGWPAARVEARMAWDVLRGRVVLFAGRANAGTLQDTWLFDPATRMWTQAASDCRKGTCPPSRWGHGMVWSSALGKVLLFGGSQGTLDLADTWTFDGTRWQQLATTGAPPARHLFGMAEDATSGKVLVYGGVDAQNRYVEPATWILDPKTGTWTRRLTPTLPTPRAEVGMTWLGSIGAVVMSTGGRETGCMSWTNTTWAFDRIAGDWRQVDTAGALPTARNAANLTANGCDGSAILTGGTHDNHLPITLADRAWILR